MDTKRLVEQYRPTDDVFDDEPEKVRLTKEAIFECLSETDRLLICLYAEIGSLRKLGELLGVSRTTAYFQIKDIKQRVKDYVASH